MLKKWIQERIKVSDNNPINKNKKIGDVHRGRSKIVKWGDESDCGGEFKENIYTMSYLASIEDTKSRILKEISLERHMFWAT